MVSPPPCRSSRSRFGTWLIPPLLAIGWWRHVRHGVALRYETTWWSIVFPLGMYSAAGHDLGVADRLPFVTGLGDVVSWVAVAAWLIAFLVMGPASSVDM